MAIASASTSINALTGDAECRCADVACPSAQCRPIAFCIHDSATSGDARRVLQPTFSHHLITSRRWCGKSEAPAMRRRTTLGSTRQAANSSPAARTPARVRPPRRGRRAAEEPRTAPRSPSSTRSSPPSSTAPSGASSDVSHSPSSSANGRRSSRPPPGPRLGVPPDPRTACFYARRALELAVAWVYKHDAALKLPYQDNLSALIHEPTFKHGRGRGGLQQGAGHQRPRQPAVHSHAPMPAADALAAVRELFHVCYWLARTYARDARPGAGPGLRPGALPEDGAGPEADRWSSCSSSKPQPARAGREARGAAGRQDGARRGAAAPARRGRRGQEGRRGAARHARLLRGRDPRLLHRPAAQGGRLAARPGARPRVRGRGHAQRRRARASSTTCSGATTASRSASSRPSARGATPRVGPAAGQALRRLPGARSSASGRSSSTPTATSTGCGTTRSYPPRAVQGFYKKAELELLIQRRSSRKPLAARRDQRGDRRALLPDARHPPHRRGLRARPRPQGAAGDGHRRGQDAHGDRAVRPADALQLGQARAVPRRPRRAGEAGGERLQDAPARRVAGEPGHREGRRGPRLRLDLSDDDGADRRDARTGSGASASATSTSSSSTRRTARSTRSTAPSSTTSTRCWWG